jgi:hypothetical protein
LQWRGAFESLAPLSRSHEESAVRQVIEPSAVFKLSRLVGMSVHAPRMRRPSPLPTMTIVPTRSSYLQRFLWMIGGH